MKLRCDLDNDSVEKFVTEVIVRRFPGLRVMDVSPPYISHASFTLSDEPEPVKLVSEPTTKVVTEPDLSVPIVDGGVDA